DVRRQSRSQTNGYDPRPTGGGAHGMSFHTPLREPSTSTQSSSNIPPPLFGSPAFQLVSENGVPSSQTNVPSVTSSEAPMKTSLVPIKPRITAFSEALWMLARRTAAPRFRHASRAASRVIGVAKNT